MRYIFALLLSLLLAPVATAQVWSSPDGPAEVTDDEQLANAQDAFLAVFYHEMGHALIDIMELPVLGLEEDAADVLSVVLINELWEAEDSEKKVRAAAGFWAQSAAEWAGSGEAPDYGGVHSPDERRYYTYVCLYYGADPEARQSLAADLSLSEDRAESCPDEYQLANDSWGPYLDELYEAGKGESLVWVEGQDEDDPFVAMMKDEVDYLNSILTLPKPLTVQVTSCGEANAYYSPSDVSVTMCTELADWMLNGESADM